MTDQLTHELTVTSSATDLDARLAPVLSAARADAARVDRDGAYPEASVDALRASGLLGLTLPTSVGGLGAGPAEFSRVVYEIAGACGSTSMIYLMHVAAAMTVASSPPIGQQDLLVGMADGSVLGTLAFSERGSRSHFWAPVSQLVPDGEGVRLRASKSWVTSAGHFQVVVASAQSAGGEGVDLFALRSGTEGMAVDGPWRGMGLRGNESSPMTLDVLTGDADRIGDVGSGFATMMGTVLPWFNLGNASVTLGLAGAAVDAAVRHSSAARFEQIGQSLADLPTIRARLSRMSIQLAVQRSYLATVAAAITAPDDSTTLHVLAVKAAANDAALDITDEAMRVCGGAAFSQHLPVERFFRDARAGHVMAPTSDVLLDFYGKAISGIPLF